MSADIVKFCPFQSSVDPSFWMKLGRVKLNHLKLSEGPFDIYGTYGITPLITSIRKNDAQSAIDDENSNNSTLEPKLINIVPGRMRLDQDSVMDDYGQDTISIHSMNAIRTIVSNEKVHVRGKIIVLNTLDSFKSLDKNELLNQQCLPTLLHACGVETDEIQMSDSIVEEDLASFICLCYLDLKNHKVLYWFAFPVLVPKPGKALSYASCTRPHRLKSIWEDEHILLLYQAFHNLRIQENTVFTNSKPSCPPFFIIVKHTDRSFTCLPLNESNYLQSVEQISAQIYFGFIDPTTTTVDDNPTTPEDVEITMGWPLRNLAAYLTLRLDMGGKNVSILSFRPQILRRIEQDSSILLELESFRLDTHNDNSLLITIQLCHREDYVWSSETSHPSKRECSFQCSGWELNHRLKPGPRPVDLSHLLSPAHLTQQAIDLNLKLMKWRMIPSLNLELLSTIQVLLLGSGTLGCNVARTLLGWGVRNITFVDNSKVSYSNPVRQSLFELSDCENGGVYKALAAAEAVKRIAGSNVVSNGVVLSIPMPGHPFGNQEDFNIASELEKLEKLVHQSDVIFLLTDTRESRWLPTVMARAANKMLINAALGLDSWLVMRHGGSGEGRLGCYFCNDVVAPENSTQNRTLDQQCTVTRPGLAPIASSLAVELMVGLMHHEDRNNAPAPPRFTRSDTASDQTPLGILPHQIRGNISSYSVMTPTVPAFEFCTGCSNAVVDEFANGGFNFIKRVCCAKNGNFLEDLSGLSRFRNETDSKMQLCEDCDFDD